MGASAIERSPAKAIAPTALRDHCGGGAAGILKISHAGVWLFSSSG
jgi:hypothetical protein